MGASLLVSAGLVKGRKMTSFHTIQDDLRNAGALWEDREVVRHHGDRLPAALMELRNAER